MKQYTPEKPVTVSRCSRYFPTLPCTDFRRTETLFQRGDCCDFGFVRHDTDAGDGRQRTESV